MQAGAGSDELCRQVGEWTIATSLVHRALAETIGQASGLSVGQYRILARLQSFGRFDRMTTLSQSTELHPSTITTTVRELESMGLCRTGWRLSDRRSTAISCTKRSEELITEVNEAIAVRVRKVWELYSIDELMLTHYDSIKTAATRKALTKYELTLDSAEKAFAESVFVNHIAERRCLAEWGISINGFLILACLVASEDGLSPATLSDRTFLRRSEISDAFKVLLQNGMIVRRQSNTDRRFAHIRIMPAARRLIVDDVAPALHQRLMSIVPEESRSKAHLYCSIANKVLETMRACKKQPF